VEDGQGVEDGVARAEGEDVHHLRDIGEQGAVREHHSLGLAFRAGGEQHHGGRFRIATRHGQAREGQGPGDQPEFVGQGELFAQIFQIEQAHVAQGRRLFDQAGLVEKQS